MLWLPVSWFYRFQVISPWPFAQSVLVTQDLVIYVRIDRELSGELPKIMAARFDFIAARGYDSWPPQFESGRMPGWVYHEAIAPIWLLAALCLIWPAISIVLQKRGERRGFPVEPKGAVEPAVSTPLPRAAEVPSESASEAERV